MDQFRRYRREFEQLVEVVTSVHNGEDRHYEPGHLNILSGWLGRIKATYGNSFTLSREDIEQQLRLIWVGSIRKLEARETVKQGELNWLLRMSLWQIRDWYRHTMRTMSHGPAYEPVNMPFMLDLYFLVYGAGYYPLSELGGYERYLLFLRYREGMTILEMAEMVGRHRETVSSHLNNILAKLRRLANANEDPGRPRNGRSDACGAEGNDSEGLCSGHAETPRAANS